MKELVEGEGPVGTDEFAAILAQIDLLYHYAMQLKVDGQPVPYCGVLQNLAGQESIERMVRSGAKPGLIRAIRSRRGRTYEACLRKLADISRPRIRRSVTAARESGEWVLWAGAARRVVQMEWYFFRLRVAHRAYLAGLPVDIAPILRKLKLLSE